MVSDPPKIDNLQDISVRQEPENLYELGPTMDARRFFMDQTQGLFAGNNVTSEKEKREEKAENQKEERSTRLRKILSLQQDISDLEEKRLQIALERNAIQLTIQIKMLEKEQKQLVLQHEENKRKLEDARDPSAPGRHDKEHIRECKERCKISEGRLEHLMDKHKTIHEELVKQTNAMGKEGLERNLLSKSIEELKQRALELETVDVNLAQEIKDKQAQLDAIEIRQKEYQDKINLLQDKDTRLEKLIEKFNKSSGHHVHTTQNENENADHAHGDHEALTYEYDAVAHEAYIQIAELAVSSGGHYAISQQEIEKLGLPKELVEKLMPELKRHFEITGLDNDDHKLTHNYETGDACHMNAHELFAANIGDVCEVETAPKPEHPAFQPASMTLGA